jgi:hypothetical protein
VLWFGMAKITFTNIYDLTDVNKPAPASESVPNWYKNTESYLGGAKKPNGVGKTTATIKRCMPVFDAITAGYILSTPADIYVSQIDGVSHFEWSSHSLIQFHPVEQAPQHPASNQNPYPKIINPWGIKTPKGYSILLTGPMHREIPFNVLPGIIDTDTYCSPVNVIIALKDPKFEGLIPKGTPFAQIIPFKREAWRMSMGGEEELKEIRKTDSVLLSTFFDSYKTVFRRNKEYK